MGREAGSGRSWERTIGNRVLLKCSAPKLIFVLPELWEVTHPKNAPWSRSWGRAVRAVPAALGDHAGFSVGPPYGDSSLDGLASLATSKGAPSGDIRAQIVTRHWLST